MMHGKMDSRRQDDIKTKSLSWRTGSEVVGLDLSEESSITNEVIERLRVLVGERCIILFRNQQLTHDQHLAFTRRFGKLALTGGISRYSAPDYPDIFMVSNKKVDGVRPETADTARQWHSDQSHMPVPAMGSLFYCVETPRYGGDTMFANMSQAYESLSSGMKEMLATLKGVHTPFSVRAELAMRGRAAFSAEEKKTMQGAIHPIVRRHPVTGKPALYCSDQLTDRFEGWTFEESKPILDYLHQHATQPAHTYRHSWRPGDLLFWDNRCTNHYAPPDYDTNNMDAPENFRLLYRSTIAGEIPLSMATADTASEVKRAS